jgi:hypothetical protein
MKFIIRDLDVWQNVWDLRAPVPWDVGWPNPIRCVSLYIVSTDRTPDLCGKRVANAEFLVPAGFL